MKTLEEIKQMMAAGDTAQANKTPLRPLRGVAILAVAAVVFAARADVTMEGATLSADADWRGLGVVSLRDGAIVDLNGHKLYVDDQIVGTGTFTDTSSLGGELHFDIARGSTFTNEGASATAKASFELSGTLKLVKEGEGVFVAARTGQSYSGGTEVTEGVLKCGIPPIQRIFGVASGDIRASAHGIVDVNGRIGTYEHRFVLDGGKLQNSGNSISNISTPQITNVCLEADSSFDAVNSWGMISPGQTSSALELGGNTLTVDVSSSARLYFYNTEMKNGTVDVRSGGWLMFYGSGNTATNVDFRVNAALTLNAPLSVRGYEAVYQRNYNGGSAELSVYGTFRPSAHDYFYGCTLQDGAVIDLSLRTNALPVVSAFTSGRRALGFADNATIGIRLGERHIDSETPIISWAGDTLPANIDSITFVGAGEGACGRFIKRADGLYLDVHDWYVDAEYGDDSADGNDWSTAKRTLQSAVEAAVDGETIYVEAGTYEPITTGNKRIYIESMNGAELTFIDGGGTNRCATLGTEASHTNTALFGFSLVNGFAPQGGGSYGGTLDCCVIRDCCAEGDDGDALGGGACYGILNNCLVAYNRATSSAHRAYGGGACNSTMRSCTVARNVSSGGEYAYGGGTYLGATYNSIVWGNAVDAPYSYGANAYSTYLYRSCADSSSQYLYSDTVTDDPLFVDADAGDFHLKAGSPCLDAGSDAYVQSDIDLDWDDRIQGDAVDMGCYEGAVAAPPGRVTGMRFADGVLTWNALPDAAGYMIYRSTRRVPSSAKCVGSATGNSFIDETAEPGAAYYYWVRAFNSSGMGDFGDYFEYTWPVRLAITTAALPGGRVHEEYSASLQAVGGRPPYVWEAVARLENVVSSSASTFSATGTAQGWQADDNCWSLNLPFEFPFYGNRYRTAYINSNGTIAFDGSFLEHSYSLASFTSHAMVAVLWKDLKTSSGNIYVESGASSVKIRWSATYYSGGTAVNASATLYADGRIVLSYGSGNANGGVCGFSAGDGTRYQIVRNSTASWANVDDIVFTVGGDYQASPESLPDGLSLSSGGQFSGIPAKSGTFAVTFRVTDAAGEFEIAEFPLSVEKNPLTFYVNAASGNDGNGGVSAASAKRTIQAAVNAAFDDDVIRVADGVYSPISTSNKCVRIESVNGAASTVIDGGRSGRCATLGTSSVQTNTALVGFTLRNGVAASGGGSYCGTLDRCIISNCLARGTYAYGGGAYYGCLNSCLVAYNCATSTSATTSYSVCGGGTYYSTLRSCTVAKNMAVGSGYVSGSGTYYGTAYNTIVWDNVAKRSASLLSVTNSYSTSLYYCCVDSSSSSRNTGTVTGDPRFVNSDKGDFRLRTSSQCVDAGYNSYTKGSADIAGAVRIQNSRVDMGCYEGAVDVAELSIKTASLPGAMEMTAYSASLEATNGVPPYSWRLYSNAGYAVTTNDASTFSATGTGQGWQDDDKCWSLSLPFEFRFYGNRYRTAYVSSNGTIAFDGSFQGYSYSLANLTNHAMIAVLWKDLTTSSGNIYVESNASSVKIRWSAKYYSGGAAVNASATLYADGRIVLSYGSGNSSGGMCGISAGDGTRYMILRNNTASWSNEYDLDIDPSRLSNGLTLSSDGTLSGIPQEAGTCTFTAVVTDGTGDTAERGFSLVVAENPNHRPVIDSVTPATNIYVKAGESATFVVTAHDPEGGPLEYTWWLDGEHVATTPTSSGGTAQYSFAATLGNWGAHTLDCMVSDGFWTNHVRQTWNFRVTRNWYVDAVFAGGSGDGSSADSAIGSIGEAAWSAGDGDVILVAPGIYVENHLDFYSDSAVSIVATGGPQTTFFTGAVYGNGTLWSPFATVTQSSMDGFTMQGSYFQGVTLRNCVLTCDETGCYPSLASGCRLFDSFVTGNVSGNSPVEECEVTRCTVAGNVVNNNGAISSYSYYSSVYDSIVWGNVTANGETANYDPYARFSNSCTMPMPSRVANAGNITTDPRLVDAVNGDLRLRVGSPCIVGGVQTMGAYLGGPVSGFVVSVRVEGNGSVSPMTAIVATGGTATLEAVAGSRPFIGWTVSGSGSASSLSADPVLTIPNVMGDLVVKAAFSNFTFHVDQATGNDANDGLSWTTAKASIQSAIEDAVRGERIYVKAGTYTPISVDDAMSLRIKGIDGKANTVINGSGVRQCANLGGYDSFSSTLVGFTLTNGSSSNGGGAEGGTLIDCDVLGNTATGNGGGLYCSTAIRCRIADNIATNSGIYAYGGGAYESTLVSCLLVGNRAVGGTYGYGGGTYKGELRNCTVVKNAATSRSGYGYGGGSYYGYLYNTIVYTNTAANGSQTLSSSSPYNCLINSDPGFVDVVGGDYRLAADSPCIDAGSNSYVTDDLDLDGNARIQHYTVDIGCYEYELATPVHDADADLAAQLAGTRYGIFVGLNQYTYASSLNGCVPDATNMQARCVKKGYWHERNTFRYLNSAATKSVVRAKLAALAAQAVSGDTVLYYQSSHGGSHTSGGVYTKDTCICLYDDEYEDYEMAEDLMRFAAGVKVVIVLDTCHSAGMFKGTRSSGDDAAVITSGIAFAQRVQALMSERVALRKGAKSGITTDDIGWIAAADYNQYSYDGPNGGKFTSAMLDGWRTGLADYDGDGRLNFHELWRYAKGIATGGTGSDASDAQCLNEDVLLGRFAGVADSSEICNTTESTPVPVALAWLYSYPAVLSSHGGDYEVTANAQSPGADGGGKRWPDGSPCYVWQDYVAGTSPTNDAVFTATIRMEGAKPMVEWTPDLNGNGLRHVRNYTVWGKTNLTDAVEWMCPTNSAHRFFKVTVELP